MPGKMYSQALLLIVLVAVGVTKNLLHNIDSDSDASVSVCSQGSSDVTREIASSEEKSSELGEENSKNKSKRVRHGDEHRDGSGCDSDSDRNSDRDGGAGVYSNESDVSVWSGNETDSEKEDTPAEKESRHFRKAQASEKRWGDVRDVLKRMYISSQRTVREDTLCTVCRQNVAVIRCLDCTTTPAVNHRISGVLSGGGGLLCGECDQRVHFFAHFHRRQDFVKGFWRPVPPSREFDAETQEWSDSATKFFPIAPTTCDGCGSKDSFGIQDEDGNDAFVVGGELVYIKHGRHNFNKVSFICQKSDCVHVQLQGPLEFLQMGAWPASASILTPKRLGTYIDESVFKEWDRAASYSPETSLKGFLRAKEAEGEDWGCGSDQQTRHKIGESAFRRAFNEYSQLKGCLKEELGMLPPHECPCCSEECRSIHCDGNRKLFTFDRNYEMWRTPYPRNKPLFYEDQEMLRYLQALDIVTGCDRKRPKKRDTHCGVGHWKSAEDSKEHKVNRDVTGVYFAVCSHGCPLKAANMVKMGERWGFAHKMLTQEYRPKQLGVFFLDIMCKWFKWYLKTCDRFDEADPSTVEFLRKHGDSGAQAVQEAKDITDPLTDLPMLTKFLCSEMHVKLHGQWCQILFGPNFSIYCGLETGEEGEQANSILSRVSKNTRNMSRVGFMAVIAALAEHICELKVLMQPKSLVIRFNKAMVEEPKARQKYGQLLAAAEERLGMKIDAMECLKQLKNLAKRQINMAESDESDAIKFFKLSAYISEAQWVLQTANASNGRCFSEQDRIMVDVLKVLPNFAKKQTKKRRQKNSNLNVDLDRAEEGQAHEEHNGGRLAQLHAQTQQLVHALPNLLAEQKKLKAILMERYPSSTMNDSDVTCDDSDVNERRLLDMGRAEVGEAVMIALQHQIEGFQMAILQHEADSSKKGATPKQKAKHVSKMNETSKKLRAAVAKYNNIVVLFPESRYTTVTFAEIRRSEYQWMVPRAEKQLGAVGDGLLRHVGLKDAIALCEAFVRTKRIKNELRMVKREMRSFMKYYQDIRYQLLRKTSELSHTMENLVTVDDEGQQDDDADAQASSSSSRRHIGGGVVDDGINMMAATTGRPSDQAEELLRGQLAIVRKYEHFVCRQLGAAYSSFSQVLGLDGSSVRVDDEQGRGAAQHDGHQHVEDEQEEEADSTMSIDEARYFSDDGDDEDVEDREHYSSTSGVVSGDDDDDGFIQL
mmetsp:Transcript_16877/g.36711  ORF Transcript_16877/g.36711 Transcript_16877/m.36711 type:complete len:1216 (-) Transcript_16877:44-3691(-)